MLLEILLVIHATGFLVTALAVWAIAVSRQDFVWPCDRVGAVFAACLLWPFFWPLCIILAGTEVDNAR